MGECVSEWVSERVGMWVSFSIGEWVVNVGLGGCVVGFWVGGYM